MHELQTNGYMNVPVDLTKDDLQEGMRTYMDFLELDAAFHDTTRFFTTQRGDGDFGQFRRQAGTDGPRGIVQDNKDIIHFGAQSRQVIESRVRGPMPRALKNFCGSAEEIFWAGERAKIQALEHLDETGQVRSIHVSEHGLVNDVLRFIAYYPNEGNLAKAHFDRSSCTLALGESHEGLRLAPGQNGMKVDCDEEYMSALESRLQPVAHKEGEAKFFLGAGWNHLPDLDGSLRELPLGWHDVTESRKHVSSSIMRWAIVLFCNPHLGVENYTAPSQPETRPYKQLGRLV